MSNDRNEILKRAQKTRKDEREKMIDLKATYAAWIAIAITALVIAWIRLSNGENIFDLMVVGWGGATAYHIYKTIVLKKWWSIIYIAIFFLFFLYYGYLFHTQYGVL